MDAREQMQRWIAWVAQHVDEVESSQIKSDIDLFTGMTGRLAGELASRNPRAATMPRRPRTTLRGARRVFPGFSRAFGKLSQL
jgi:hypothetical protein